MLNKNLVLVGGGGHCQCLIDVAELLGYKILCVLDDNEKNIGKRVLNYEIVGTSERIPDFVDKAHFLIAVGQIKSAQNRIKLYKKIIACGGQLETLIAPTAYVSKYAQIGVGSVIMHKVFVNVNAKIGDGCIISSMADIEHSVHIGNFCHISTGVMINGDSTIGNNVFIGSQSVVDNGITIVDDCVITSGAVIKKNISVPGIYVRNTCNIKLKE